VRRKNLGQKKSQKPNTEKIKHPKKKEDFVEMAAFKYIVEDRLHPFRALNGRLTVDRVYEVAAKSLKKGLLKVADENLLTSASRKSDLETLMKLMLAQTMKPAVEKPAAEKPEEKTSELLTSPQLKRKASRNLEAPSAKEEDERCEPNLRSVDKAAKQDSMAGKRPKND